MATKKVDDETLALAAATEKQLDLPAGSLAGFVREGGSLTKEQRARVLEREGLDAGLSRRNEIAAVGYALKDALANNKGDASLALAEVYSGPDRTKWNTATTRFASAARGVPPAMTSSLTPAIDYGTGQSMEPEAAPVALPSAPAAAVPPPAAEAPAMGSQRATNPAAAGEMEGARAATAQSLTSYRDGTMPADRRAEFERLVSIGALTVPAGFEMTKAPEPTTLENIVSAPGRAIDAAVALPGAVKEAWTGDQRRTPETDAAPDWSEIPEWEGVASVPKLLSLTASPKEALQILASNAPGVTIREDEKGNLWAFSPKANKEFVVKPGAQVSDIPRVGATVASFIPAGRALGLARMVGGAALTQGALEVGQKASGGEFNPEDIAIAAASAGAAPLLGAAGRGAGNAALARVPGYASAPVAAEFAAARSAAPAVAAVADDAARAVTPSAPAAPASSGAASTAALPDEELGRLARQATGRGQAAEQAREQLAQQFSVDAGLADRAKALGFDLPADVFSDNAQIVAAVGGLRSKVGSEAAATFGEQVKKASTQTDNLLMELGADANAARISSATLDTLEKTAGELKSQAKTLYNDIDAALPRSTPAKMDNVVAALQERATNLGGVERLKPIEKELLELATDPRTTYESIRELKAKLGDRIARQASPYDNLDDVVVKRLYGAVSEDQLANVAAVGGDELRKKAVLASRLTAKQKGLEDRIVKVFGKDKDGSIATLLEGAITDASSGNTKRLTQVLKVIPKEMQPEAIITGLSSLSQSQRKDAAGFDFGRFTKVYRGLHERGNEQTLKAVEQALGPKKAPVLRDLYELSQRITKAESAVIGTGKGNQPFMQGLGAQNFLEQVLTSPVGKSATVGVGASVGSAAGPAGAGVGAAGLPMLVSLFVESSDEVAAKAGKMLVDPDFQALVLARARGSSPAVLETAAKKASRSKAVLDYVRGLGGGRKPTDAEAWLQAALQSERQTR